jgi:hypothetical protein
MITRIGGSFSLRPEFWGGQSYHDGFSESSAHFFFEAAFVKLPFFDYID